jgi:CBS domain-containing protein
MKAEELMVKPKIISPEETVSKVSGILNEEGLREVLVAEKGRLLGMINPLWMAEVAATPDTKVNSIMFSPPTVKPTDDIEQVIRKMVDNAIETIPVIDSESLIGVVTTEGIFKKATFDGRVRDVMVDAISIQSKETINKARRIMRLHRINRLPVVDGNKIVGIISTSDIVTKMKKGGHTKRSEMIGDIINLLDAPVESIMTRSVFTVNADDSLNDAAKKMIQKDVRALPVVSNNRLLGILCRKDMLKTLYPYVSGIMVNFSGLKDIGDWDVMQLKRATADWTRRLNNYADFSDILVDVKKLHGGNVYRINLHTSHMKKEYLKKTASKDHKAAESHFIAHAEGHGLVVTANDAFSKLERIMSDSKTK